MGARFDAVVLGAGHNGLVAAFYLARAGLRVLVLERRATIGGLAVTEEFAPGFRSSTVSHGLGPLLPSIAADLDLARRGVVIEAADPRLTVLAPHGSAFRMFTDPLKTAGEAETQAAGDGQRYLDFHQALAAIGPLMSQIVQGAPPDPGGTALWDQFALAARFRSLGRAHVYRLLRWLPMPAADLASESFSGAAVQAAVVGRALRGALAAPRAAGTGAMFLVQTGFDPHPAGPSLMPRGGLGAVANAIADAATAQGAEIQSDEEVVTIELGGGSVAAVRTANGTRYETSIVLSSLDPKRTFLQLLDPMAVGPELRREIENLRNGGGCAKVNLAVSALPTFAAFGALSDADRRAVLRGRLQLAPHVDDFERAYDAAKYGDIPAAPCLEVVIPSIGDESLAPPGHHVMSILVHFTPAALRTGGWSDRKQELGDRVAGMLEAHAPGITGAILHRQVITPEDIERDYGVTGGHYHHLEPSLDQLLFMRPLLGWSRYRTPVDGLYLCGAGTHPAGGVTGAPGLNAATAVLEDLRTPFLPARGAGV